MTALHEVIEVGQQRAVGPGGLTWLVAVGSGEDDDVPAMHVVGPVAQLVDHDAVPDVQRGVHGSRRDAERLEDERLDEQREPEGGTDHDHPLDCGAQPRRLPAPTVLRGRQLDATQVHPVEVVGLDRTDLFRRPEHAAGFGLVCGRHVGHRSRTIPAAWSGASSESTRRPISGRHSA